MNISSLVEAKSDLRAAIKRAEKLCAGIELILDMATKPERDDRQTLEKKRIRPRTFAAQCECFKEAIISANVTRRRATLSVIKGRCKWIRILPQYEVVDIIKALVDRGEIVVDTSRKTTSYRLAG